MIIHVSYAETMPGVIRTFMTKDKQIYRIVWLTHRIYLQKWGPFLASHVEEISLLGRHLSHLLFLHFPRESTRRKTHQFVQIHH